MSWLIPHLEIVILLLLGLVAAVVILQQRRAPQATAAWLLFILVLPYVALPLFLALGFRKRNFHGRQIRFTCLTDSPPEASQRCDATLRSYSFPPALAGHGMALLSDPKETLDALLGLVDSAEKQINAQFYIVENDPTGRVFLAALTQRAKAGVKVRLIIDRLGTLFPPRAAIKSLQDAGGDVRFFSPIVQRPQRGHLNLRNHRKILLIDDTTVFSGGMNVAQQYMATTPDDDVWSDLAFTLTGPAVTTFNDIFWSDWVGITGGEIPPSLPVFQAKNTGTIAQVVPSGPDFEDDTLHDTLVNAIHTARHRVWVATPYFLPTEPLNNALVIAARRGVDVQLLIPRKSNQKLADFARGAYLRDMKKAGCTIQLYRDGMMHAKAGVIDDAAFVGSANFDVRSMQLNFELAIFVYDAPSVEMLANWFNDLREDCDIGLPSASLPRRLAEGVFRLGAPIL